MANDALPVSMGTAEGLYAALKPVFEELIRAGEGVELASQAKLIIRFKFSAPEAELVLNCRKKPVELGCGASQVRSNLDLVMPAATLHGILTGRTKLADAVKSGGLKAKGEVLRLPRLSPVLDAAAKLYTARLAAGGEPK
ncbi:MAG: hypothetical protein HYZ53_23525 [Planctomycetes bacterium]|nr:hypothetical protein [Planctomycetota bacterium]